MQPIAATGKRLRPGARKRPLTSVLPRVKLSLEVLACVALCFSTVWIVRAWFLMSHASMPEDPANGQDDVMEDGDEGDYDEDADEGTEGEVVEARPRTRRRWVESKDRSRINYDVPLPPVDGLPIRFNPKFSNRTTRRTAPAPTASSSSGADELAAARRHEYLADMFIHQGNLAHLLPSDSRWTLKNNRSFPDADMSVLSRYNFSTCAVVGNSGSLLNASFGAAIDSHETVMRINQAPCGKFHRHVGRKTTFRLINTRWTNKYADTRFVGEGLPLEPDVTLVVTRAKARAYDNLAQYLKMARSDVRVLYLSSRVISAARRLMVAYRLRLDAVSRGIYFGGSTPSSGYSAIYFMLQACQNLTVYGFGLDAENGAAQEYHYFHLFTPKESKKKNSMNRTHSFDAERDLLRALHEAGYLQYCGYIPHDRKHNKQCGMKPKAAKVFSKQLQVDFAEMDAGKTIAMGKWQT
eukprot:jgi/Mesvir1/4247/Mv22215-RA.1